MESKLLKIIDDIDQSKSYGGKADNIIRLYRNGFNVPKTWIIDSDYICDIIKNRLNIDLFHDKCIDYSIVIDFLNHFPKDLYKDMIKEISTFKENNPEIKHFAVRSSHLYEDGENFSFSGLFKTELNLYNSFDIVSAILSCYVACFDSSILEYSKKFGVTNVIPCSLVFQEFIESQVSGVIFRSKENIYINCTLGMAKSIVDGKTGFDSWIFNYEGNKLISYTNNKNIITMPINTKTNPRKSDYIPFFFTNESLKVLEFNNENKYILVDLSEKLRKDRSLTNDQISHLIKKCANVAKKLKISYYDIEWAYENDELLILQCRPLTRFIAPQSVSNDYMYLPLAGGKATGKCYFVETENDAKQFPQNGLLVAKNLNGPAISAAMKASGCILESKSPLSHSSIIAREIGIPAVGAVDLSKIEYGKSYCINGDLGTIEIVDNDIINNSNAVKKTNDNCIDNDKIKKYTEILESYEGDIGSYI